MAPGHRPERSDVGAIMPGMTNTNKNVNDPAIRWDEAIEVYDPSHPKDPSPAAAVDLFGNRVVLMMTRSRQFRALQGVNNFGQFAKTELRVRNVRPATPKAHCTNGDPLEVGDVAVSGEGNLLRVDAIAEDVRCAVWYGSGPEWLTTSIRRCLDGRAFDSLPHEQKKYLLRLATPSDFPDSMPIDDVPPKYRDPVKALREKAEQPRDYAKGVTAKGRSVEFLLECSASSGAGGCWAIVGSTVLFVNPDGNVREAHMTLGHARERLTANNRWPWPDIVLANIDAYMDQLEKDRLEKIWNDMANQVRKIARHMDASITRSLSAGGNETPAEKPFFGRSPTLFFDSTASV